MTYKPLRKPQLTPSPNVREMSFGRLSGQAPGKVFLSADAALADVHDGAIVMLDGFAGPGGMAQHLIVTLRDQGAKGLTMISNTAGIARVTSFGTPPGYRPIDHSLLVDNGQIHKAIASFPSVALAQTTLVFRAGLPAGRGRVGAVAPGDSGRANQDGRLRHRGFLHSQPALEPRLPKARKL